MIQLLRINAKSIRIPLHLPNPHHLIQIAQPTNLLEKRQRLDPSELVEIPRGDDRRVLVGSEEGSDEGGRDVGLGDAFVEAAVDGRAGIAL